MKKKIQYFLTFLSVAALLTSCEEDVPEVEIPAEVDSISYLDGKWFLKSLSLQNGSYTSIVQDADDAVVDENGKLNYIINLRNPSTAYELNFDSKTGGVTESGLITLNYGVLTSDILVNYNDEASFPERLTTNDKGEFEKVAPFNRRLVRDMTENYFSLFGVKPINEQGMTFKLVDEKTITVSFKTIEKDSEGIEQIVDSSVTMDVVFATDSALRLSYTTSPNTTDFGNKVLNQNFETGISENWKTPFFFVENTIIPQSNDYGAKVTVELTRGGVLTADAIKALGALEVTKIEKDVEGDLTLSLNRDLIDFTPSEIKSFFSYVTEDDRAIPINEVRFLSEDDRTKLFIDVEGNTQETVTLSFAQPPYFEGDTDVPLLLDGYDIPLSAFDNFTIKAKNFFGEGNLDFSNPDAYNVGDLAGFNFQGTKPTGFTKFEIVKLDEDQKPAGFENDGSLTLRITDSNIIPTNYYRAFTKGGDGDVKLAPGDYKISFWAKSTHANAMRFLFAVDKWWTVNPLPYGQMVRKGSGNDSDTFTKDWEEYEIKFTAGAPNTYRPDGETVRFYWEWPINPSFDGLETLIHDFKLVQLDSPTEEASAETVVE